MNFHKIAPLFILIASITFAMTPAKATLLVYEGFDYTNANPRPGDADTAPSRNDVLLRGKNGGLGFSSAWAADAPAVNNDTDLFISTGSLSFGDLPTYGHQTRSDTNQNSDIMSRTLGVSLDGGNNELWFSFLANKIQNNFNAGREGIVIANGVVSAARIDQVTGGGGFEGFGIAPTSAGDGLAWTAYGWDGTDRIEGAPGPNVAVNGTETNFLFGRIQYDAGAGGADIFTLYSYNLAASGGTVVPDMAFLDLITSIEVDVDQSLLNTLNLTRQVNTAFDEISIGTTLNSVITPEPSKALLLSLGAFGWFLRRRRSA